mgnify:CR=1 FL=1
MSSQVNPRCSFFLKGLFTGAKRFFLILITNRKYVLVSH